MADLLRIREFPKGRWWVYWVDQYVPKLERGHGAGVYVVLAPYKEEYDYQNNSRQSWPLLPVAGSTKTIAVGVRLIPALVIGSIFTDGLQDGYINSMEQCTRSFDLTRYPSEIEKASTEFLPKPRFWTDYPSRVLSLREYPLGPMLASWCVILRSADEHTIIPCHEVFRAFYGTIADFAETLVRGPWDKYWIKVGVEKATHLNPDGSWQVSVQRRIPDPYQAQLGYMLFGQKGRAQSNAIYANFFHKENKAKLGSLIKVELPFDRTAFNLTMRRVRLQHSTNKYLCTSILKSSYPCELSNAFFATRANENSKGLEQVETGKPKPYDGVSKSGPIHPREKNIAEVASEKDANERYYRENCAVEPIEWFDAPEKLDVVKEKSGRYDEGSKRPRRLEVAELASANASGYSDTERGPIDVVRGEVLPPELRYELLVKAFETLLQAKKIDAWSVITPLNIQRRHGVHPVWLFPTHLRIDQMERQWAWSYVDRKTDTRRSALVLKVVFNAVSCIWLEVECRAEQGFRSVLFRNTTQELDIVVIANVLAECAFRKGIVYQGVDLRRHTGLEHLETWKHSVKKGTMQLNEVSMLAVLKRLTMSPSITK